MLRYLPYDQTNAIPNIIVDGTANEGTTVTLSHWRRSGTPVELAADTSTEIVFKYLDTPRFHVEAEVVSNNHFDDDGVFGVFTLTNTGIASKHRELLIDAAQAGDFNVYKDRNAARLAFVTTAYADPEKSPLPTSIFRLRYPELAAELYRAVLDLMPALLDDLESYRPIWEEPDRQLTDSEKLLEGGIVTIEERPDLDLAIVRYPDFETPNCHPFAIHSRTERSRLLTLKRGKIEFQYRYESWVRMASRRPALRVDLTPLVEELNREEGSSAWTFAGVDQVVPRLHRSGRGPGVITHERFLDLLERQLRSGVPAWNPYD
jgi:hypothetical protein